MTPERDRFLALAKEWNEKADRNKDIWPDTTTMRVRALRYCAAALENLVREMESKGDE